MPKQIEVHYQSRALLPLRRGPGKWSSSGPLKTRSKSSGPLKTRSSSHGPVMRDALLLATLPSGAFRKIFLFVGVSPSGFAPCKAVYTLFKAAGVWLRRGSLLRATEYGGDVCQAERCGCKKCQGSELAGCVRPRGHTGRCICWTCWESGTERWFPKMRLCSKCHCAILGVPSPCGTMHWGCYRGLPPPYFSSKLLPEYTASCLL